MQPQSSCIPNNLQHEPKTHADHKSPRAVDQPEDELCKEDDSEYDEVGEICGAGRLVLNLGVQQRTSVDGACFEGDYGPVQRHDQGRAVGGGIHDVDIRIKMKTLERDMMRGRREQSIDGGQVFRMGEERT